MRPIAAVAAGLVVTVLVAAGVTLAVLRIESRTNAQQVNLGSNVRISEESGIVQAAAKARPAVVSVITQIGPSRGPGYLPTAVGGSGYVATSDGYIVTNTSVIADAKSISVLIPGDSKLHDSRLVDYDCQTGVAVIKIDNVNGLPTLAFADPTALVQGQVIVAISGPAYGSAITPGYVTAMHRESLITDPTNFSRTIAYSDTIQTSTNIDTSTSGGPLLNVGGQVIGVAVPAPPRPTFGLNVADIQDDVQQILQSGHLTVASLAATTQEITPDASILTATPEGSQITALDKNGPANGAGLQVGDIITQVDDVSIDAAHPLSLLLRSRFHANQRVTVTYTRGSNSTQAQLTLTSEHPVCQ